MPRIPEGEIGVRERNRRRFGREPSALQPQDVRRRRRVHRDVVDDDEVERGAAVRWQLGGLRQLDAGGAEGAEEVGSGGTDEEGAGRSWREREIGGIVMRRCVGR